MKKIERRQVDDHLPKWLHSKFLSAIHYIWEARDQDKGETIKRVDNVWASGQYTDEEMSWIMLLLILPKANEMIKNSQEFQDFKAMKKASVH